MKKILIFRDFFHFFYCKKKIRMLESMAPKTKKKILTEILEKKIKNLELNSVGEGRLSISEKYPQDF